MAALVGPDIYTILEATGIYDVYENVAKFTHQEGDNYLLTAPNGRAALATLGDNTISIPDHGAVWQSA